MEVLGCDLSIVIPTYNVEDYILETIHSIIRQKTNYKIEVIFIDDGSCDNTVDIINEYVYENNNYRLYIQEHQGAGAARNLGISKATGKYIYFFDSDDLLKIGMIQALLDYLINENLDIIYFSGRVFWDEGYTNTKFKPNYSRIDFFVNSGVDAFSKMWETKTYTPSPCLYICKREILIKNDLFFPEDIMHEDNYFTFFLVLSCGKSRSIKNSYYKRRIREGSVMTNNRQKFSFLSLVEVYKESLTRIQADNLLQGTATNKYINDLYKRIFYEYALLMPSEKKNSKIVLKEVKQSYREFYGYSQAKIRHYYYWGRRTIRKLIRR